MPRKSWKQCDASDSVFAKRLTKAMKMRGENQTTLAQKITEKYVTIQRQTISLYMNGQSKPDTERLTAIAKVLNVSADYLLGISDENLTANRTEWISVKNMLPYTPMRCITYDPLAGLQISYWNNGFYGGEGQVTHWMEAPLLPIDDD